MRKLIDLIILLLLISAVPQAVLAATPLSSLPTRIDAEYDVFKDDFKIGTITGTFTLSKDGYHIESLSKATGLFALIKPEVIQVNSKGIMTKNGLRPITYVHERKLGMERNTRADFDWQANLITLTDRNGKRTLPLPAETQDRASAIYQFMFTPLQDSTELNFNVTDGSRVKEYKYRVTNDQSVTVPLGTFKSSYVSSLSRGDEKRTEIWLATEHFNFPYKMIITESDGSKAAQVLTHIHFER